MTNEYLLEMRHITKSFPSVKALDDISFTLKPGEVHVLLGENGAGKSTLMKVLAGAYIPDEGELYVDGELLTHLNPITAKKKGIGIIYQEFNLIPYLNVAENIFIDNMPRKNGLINKKKMHADAQKMLSDMKMNVNTYALARSISVAQQQMVEVAKALTHHLKILLMDEPTATLSDLEIKQLFEMIRTLTRQGIGVIYISHRLQEVSEIGDRVTILRDGKYICTKNINEISTQEIVKLMVGREITNLYKRDYQQPGELALKVEHLYSAKEKLEDINFDLHRGEIVGLAGLVGSGRTELARAILHIDPYEKGEITLLGQSVGRKETPANLIEKGLSLIPEDRKRQGLSLVLPLSQNIVISSLGKLNPWGWIRSKSEKRIVDEYIKELNIVTPSSRQRMLNLSGGNQQKVVLAKWLCTKTDVIIFDEPTRGIDVGAKGEFYTFMNELVKQGKAILMISSELPEIIGISDRIYVMRNRKIVKEINSNEATQEFVISYAMEGALKEERNDG